MKIEEIKAFPLSYRYPETAQVSLGIGTAFKRDIVIVRVRTQSGVIGYGEAHAGRSPRAVTSIINDTLGPLLLGKDAHDINGVWALAHQMQLASHGLGGGSALALSGIDMALWDARGKALDLPLYRLLGGSKKPIKAYAGGVALGYQEPETLIEEAKQHIATGYRAIKLRVGDSVERDILRVKAVRDAVGPNIDILVDANTAYRLRDVRRVMPVLEDLAIGWLEEPFPCDDFASYRAAANISRTVPMAAGENHFTRFAFARLIEDQSVQIFQPDLSKTGGVSETMRIAALASAWGIPINPHSSAGGFNMAATIHVLSAIENPGYFEACVSKINPLRDMFGLPFSVDATGCVQPLDAPGVGLNVDEKLFAEFPLIDGLGFSVKN